MFSFWYDKYLNINYNMYNPIYWLFWLHNNEPFEYVIFTTTTNRKTVFPSI